MATLNIVQFAGVVGGSIAAQVAHQPALAEANVTIGAASAASDAFVSNTLLVRLATDTACFVTFGADPTATTSKTYLPAGHVEYFKVPPGESYKVAVIEA